MSMLDEYLSGTYDKDKGCLAALAKLVKSVLPVFTEHFDETKSTWPYKVSTGGPSEINGLSHSTHSMILFTLETIISPSRNSVLMPAKYSRLEIEQPSNLEEIVEMSRHKLVSELTKAETGHLTESDTWGDQDPLTLTWLCELVAIWKEKGGLESKIDPILEPLMVAAEEACQRHIDEPLRWSVKNKNFVPPHVSEHSFLRLRGNQLAAAASNLGRGTIPHPVSVKCFQNVISEQLAYSSITDSRFDPAQLAFALEGVLQENHHSLNTSTIEHILDTLEDAQNRQAHWRPVMPLFGNDQGMVLFPVSVEIVCSLLRTCQILDADSSSRGQFSRFEPQFRRYYDWLEARIERGFCNEKPFLGWHSEHVNEPEAIHLWETSQALLFLVDYAAMLQRKVSADGLRAAGLIPRQKIIKIDTFWDDDPVRSVGEDSAYRVLTKIKKIYLDANRSHGSILLYGPPGTGKTTVAEQMAVWMDRSFVSITVSDFLAGGAAEVEARAKGIFRVLCEQDHLIILLDEIDQFLLDRDSEAYKNQTGIFQFMTPGMLTKLQDLKDARRSIFIIATNYADRIDSAIKRRGRLEDHLLLNIPGEEQRIDFTVEFIKRRRKKESLTILPDLREQIENSALPRRSVFFGFGDLKLLVKSCNFDDWQNPADKLAEACNYITPSVKLEFYGPRFEGEVGDELVEEFFLLVYVLAEVDEAEPSATELTAIGQALACINKKDTDSLSWKFIKERLEQSISDRQVTDTLIQWLKMLNLELPTSANPR